MTRDQALQLMSWHLYRVFKVMYLRCKHHVECHGYAKRSAGFSSGGSVGYESSDDLGDEQDVIAANILETFYFEKLTKAEQAAIEQAVFGAPAVWTYRDGVLDSAIKKLEGKLREICPA